MKNIIILILVVLILGGGYFLISNKTANNDRDVITNEVSIEETNLDAPSRPAEINGTVVSVEGNIIVVSNEVGKEQLTEEERDARKEEMANLSQEERQAQRQQELESMETEDVEIVIPVGVPISKGSGDASGDNISAEISEIIKGTYVSIWVNEGNTPEFVKIKGLGQ